MAISRSRCSAATLWFSAGSSSTWYSSQPVASSSVSLSAEIGCRTRRRLRRTTDRATGRPLASRRGRWRGGRASRSTGCGARLGAEPSRRTLAKLTPCSGAWVTPRIVAGGSTPEQVEDGGDHVDDVRVLRAHLASCQPTGRPRDDERVGRSAAVGLALPAAERGVPGERPAPRVVVEVVGATDLVDRGEALLQRLLGVVEELRLVRRAGRAALGARAVVGDHHHDRVVELTDLLEEVEQPAEVVVGVAQEPGEHLHHAGRTAGGRRATASPSRGRRGRAATARCRREQDRAPSAGRTPSSR